MLSYHPEHSDPRVLTKSCIVEYSEEGCRTLQRAREQTIPCGRGNDASSIAGVRCTAGGEETHIHKTGRREKRKDTGGGCRD